jgi:hypothetical protein
MVISARPTVNHSRPLAVSRFEDPEVRMPPIVYENAAASRRLADLALSEQDLAAARRGADAEARKWTALAPKIMPGIVRWGKTNELLRTRLLARGWTQDSPKGLPRTISPAREFAIVATTGDSATGLRAANPATKYAKGVQTVLAIGRNVQLAFEFSGLDLQDVLWTVAAEDDGLATWLLLYHVASDEIRAELSLASGTDRHGHVSAWIERIILPVIDLT